MGETSVSPVIETGSRDRVAGDDSLSQAMLQILKRVAGPNARTKGRGSVAGVTPNVAEYWMEATERIMVDLDFTAKKKLKGAVSLLRDEAYQCYINVRRWEFLNLTQGDRSMAEYEAEFLRLSRYARGMVASEYERCVGFEDGLRDSLRVLIASQRECEFVILVEKTNIAEDLKHVERHPSECWRTTRACLRFGSTEHRVRDCPLRIDEMQASVTGTAQLPRRYSGRHYRYVFTLYVPYLALIDIGSTHSYVASTVSETLGIPIESIDSEVMVLSPLGQSIRVSKLYRDVSLEVQETVFMGDLMKLPFGEFDLILGMDWLVKHRVSLDCATKRVILRTEENNEVMVIGEQRDYLTNVILALVAKKLVRNGCQAFLAYVSISGSKDSSVKDIRTMRDFSDIFLEELPGLSPSCEVEFGIELIPGTAPVTIAPYRMAPKELTELKA
ncbi:uncharacterized protein LOC108481170 [Gossypium arboreum]|uniref:uncharacterized protein LOC108481170 n=1 Tax=Gossypium arboreum TaxID=29729 RepID=UPI0008193F25|nr:uncharacterized protein LOC108481170 [Gossypium arboreum]